MARGEERLLGVDLESSLSKNGQAGALLRLWRCSTIVTYQLAQKLELIGKGPNKVYFSIEIRQEEA